ncbi:MAG: glycosyltransferase [Bacteroidia bacterium]|nr:glycosyltransferase [Bacteroidia bacterium]
MKISMFVHSLGDNPIVRAKPIAEALMAMGHEVQILGLLINADDVYRPYRGMFNYVTMRSSDSIWDVYRMARKLSRLADGDIVYACKPLVSSFFPALVYTDYGREKPIILDVEDDDVMYQRPSSMNDWFPMLFRGWRKAFNYKFNIPLDRYVSRCSGVTVSSEKLRRHYGGKIMLTGPAQVKKTCDIGSCEQVLLKRRFGLPSDKYVLLFAGTARLHKGFDIIAQGALDPRFSDHFHLALAGDPEQALFKDMKRQLGADCSLLGLFDSDNVFEVIGASDIVPVIQKHCVYTESQIPAKLLEAFACGRPVIGSRIGDLPHLILDGPHRPRGWILEKRSAADFVELLLAIIRSDGRLLASRGLAGISFYKDNCSTMAIQRVLQSFKILSGSTIS